MDSRRGRFVYASRLVTFLFGAWLVVGCAPPPPEPASKSSETDAHKKEHHPRRDTEGDGAPRHEEKRDEPSHAEESRNSVPKNVLFVLKYVEEHHEAPAGYEGGREFHNYGGRNEESLPRRDDHGRAIAYQEWDVNRKVRGVNRGAERLITGSDGSAFYTSDHYRTFTKIR